jgi:hypothetical protein
LDAIEAQLHEMRSLKGWRLNLIRENLEKAKAAIPSAAQARSTSEEMVPKEFNDANIRVARRFMAERDHWYGLVPRADRIQFPFIDPAEPTSVPSTDGKVTMALELDCRWYRFADAPAGSYACLWAKDGTMQSAEIAWMPLSRGQIPVNARVGMVLPIPELSALSSTHGEAGK